jgi:hypothetical protein
LSSRNDKHGPAENNSKIGNRSRTDYCSNATKSATICKSNAIIGTTTSGVHASNSTAKFADATTNSTATTISTTTITIYPSPNNIRRTSAAVAATFFSSSHHK